MNSILIENRNLDTLIRWWLTGVLLILPFHYRIVKSISAWNPVMANYINKLEEITIVVLLPLAIIKLFKKEKENYYQYLVLSIPFIVFTLSGYTSGFVEGNSLFITTHAIFHYIKYFLAIFIYAAFFTKFEDFVKMFRLLFTIAIFLVTVAFIQELWALISRYILDMDINDKSMYIFSPRSKGLWRFGIYRAPSLIGHYNVLGLYSLLILAIYLSIVRRINYAVVISLFTGVFVSVSRMIYTASLFILGFEIYRKRWIMFFFLITISCGLFLLASLPDFNVIMFNEGHVAQSEEISSLNSMPTSEHYRVIAREKGIEVWKDHPFWGVGPGMFGSEIASQYRSPVYEEYNFLASLNWFDTLDQFWPQVLAETGIIGTGAFSMLLLTLFIIFTHSLKTVSAEETKGLFIGLMLYMAVLIIFSFGGILNHPPILFTYCALAGMGLGCAESNE